MKNLLNNTLFRIKDIGWFGLVWFSFPQTSYNDRRRPRLSLYLFDLSHDVLFYFYCLFFILNRVWKLSPLN